MRMGGLRAAAVAAVAATAALLAPRGAAAVQCTNWQKCDPRSRRILFIMDASLSISQEHFDKDMVDFVVNTYCGFRDTTESAKYEVGVVTFNMVVETRIPFQELGQNEFETLMHKKVKDKTPLRCCTAHAEAAILAREMFEEADEARPGFENIAFFITDGVPYPNYYGGKYGVHRSTKARSFYESRGLAYDRWDYNHELVWTQGGGNRSEFDEIRVTYGTRNVPFAMRDLKDADVRVFFIGVPHIEADQPVNIDYFTGQVPNLEVCYENGNVDPPETSCGRMEYAPLVSEPVDDHAFRVESWDLTSMIDRSLSIICREQGTPGDPFGRPMIPTASPTGSPSQAPTAAPSTAPTSSPTPIICESVPRDLMILVDTSESMDPLRYANEMMEIVKDAAAQLDFTIGSRVGVATFGSSKNTRIILPLRHYDNLTMFDAIVDENVAKAKLRCCTDFAEAFVMLREHFSNNYIEGHDKIVLTVTDGTPYQNYGNGRWEWNTHGRALTRCEYTTFAVPQQAALLRADGVRIVLAGVPNIDGRPPMADFFDGALAGKECCANVKNNTACLVSGDPLWCVDNFDPTDTANIACKPYTSDRVVSEGEGNIFTAESWDTSAIKHGIKQMICRDSAVPTMPPTPQPTPPPSLANGPDGRPITPTSPRNALEDGFDLIVVLDGSAQSDTQYAICANSVFHETCTKRLAHFAGEVLDGFQALVQQSGQIGVAAVTTTCLGTSVVGDGSPVFATTQADQREVLQVLSRHEPGAPSCLVPGLMRAGALLDERDQPERPAVVLLLTHDGEAADACSLASAVPSISQRSRGIKLLAATVGTSSSHIEGLQAAYPTRNVFTALDDATDLVARVTAILG